MPRRLSQSARTRPVGPAPITRTSVRQLRSKSKKRRRLGNAIVRRGEILGRGFFARRGIEDDPLPIVDRTRTFGLRRRRFVRSTPVH